MDYLDEKWSIDLCRAALFAEYCHPTDTAILFNLTNFDLDLN